ncbi:MAG: DUF4215 domain-containing protein, partial [Myxococcales bacterium]|nr:DUF4215 domain-containing protein [Myxococcales bacterium]
MNARGCRPSPLPRPRRSLVRRPSASAAATANSATARSATTATSTSPATTAPGALDCEALPWCGDGIHQPDHEACDDGDLDNKDDCLTSCEAASCGDGYLHTGVEQCDFAATNDCTNECTLPGCGNGVVDEGEECDDGNTDETDECTSMCADARCGDGFTQVSNEEECDDGNEDDDDGCNTACARDRVVFVTSEIYSGYELGGLVGADAICQSFANDAELENADS